MKLPTSTKPTSGFHICDILELNKEKQKQKQDEADHDEDVKSKNDENCDDEEVELKRENVSVESDENLIKNEKRKHTLSPTSPMITSREPSSPVESHQNAKEFKKLKKYSKHDDERPRFDPAHHQLLNETIHQYPHLFQNHPAMRPWFNSNGKLIKIQNSSAAPETLFAIFRLRFDEPF